MNKSEKDESQIMNLYGFDNQIISVIKTEVCSGITFAHDKEQHSYREFFSTDIRHQQKRRENAYYKNNSSSLISICIRIIFQIERIEGSFNSM